MGLHDAVFLPSRACISTAFLKKYGRDESLEITTCLRTVVGDKQRHAPCKIPFLQQSSSLCSIYLVENIGRLARMSVLDTEVDGSNPGSSMLFP